MMEMNHDQYDEYIRNKYVIENIKDVVWEVDRNLIFTFVSPAVKAMTGFETDDLLGRSILEFLTANSKQYIFTQWNGMMQDKANEPMYKSVLYDVEFICKDDSTLWCEVCVKPIFKNEGCLSFIGTTRDVSEKKQLDQRLKEYLAELELKNMQLEKLANLDMLTGAYNRRRYDDFVSTEIEKNEIYGSPFSIIMFDIDNFKEINDTIGHKKGDSILQEITSLIIHTLRVTDKLFRWGGDEFVILLPDLDLRNAMKVAVKVREAVEAYDFDIGDKKITLSLGVGSYVLNEKPDQFVNRVDNALLKAKINGKNKVEQS